MAEDKSKAALNKAKDFEKRADTYNASQIQVLGGLEAVRKRPGMYIGSTSSQGLHHLVWEIIDNSIDERLAGFATKIEITVNEDGSVTVQDDGRGIPVDIQAKTSVSALSLRLSVKVNFKPLFKKASSRILFFKILSSKVVVSVKISGSG